jgi:hypothetical protein
MAKTSHGSILLTKSLSCGRRGTFSTASRLLIINNILFLFTQGAIFLQQTYSSVNSNIVTKLPFLTFIALLEIEVEI